LKIIMPFNYIDDYYWHRYRDQILPIAKHVDRFTITANSGVQPKKDNSCVDIVIYDREHGPNNKIQMLRKKLLSFKGFTILRKIERRKRIAEYFDFVDGDIIYGLSGGTFQQTEHSLLKRVLGLPMVHRMRGDAKLELSHFCRGINRILYNQILNCTVLDYDYHIPINARYYKILRQYRISKDRISRPIGLGVDCGTFKPCNSPDRFTVGYFGRLSPEKGIDFMLSLMTKTPDINYVVVGKKMMNVTFPENVYYHRPVHHGNMPKYYDLVDVVILPSYTEGVSNIFPESYASGKPVVCSHAAHDSSIPVYGYKLPHNIDAWKKTLTHLDQETAKIIGLKAREWALGYSWERFGSKMIKQFKKVLEND